MIFYNENIVLINNDLGLEFELYHKKILIIKNNNNITSILKIILNLINYSRIKIP